MIAQSFDPSSHHDASHADVRMVIVCPVRLLRDGLASLFEQRFGAHNVCTAADLGAALQALAQFKPTLILLDVATEDGLGVARSLSATAAEIPILGFAARAHDHDVLAYARAGITGFVSREASTQELFAAIDHAARGEMLCSPRVTAALFRNLVELANAEPTSASDRHLTGREAEIVRCIDSGLSNKEIARHLSIELSTVKNHVHNILDKLKVSRRGEAAARARSAAPAHGSSIERSIHL